MDGEINGAWKGKYCVLQGNNDVRAVGMKVFVKRQRSRRDVWQITKGDGCLNGIDLVEIDAGAIHRDDVLRFLDVRQS